ncbi:MAG: DUF4450 domain-containing protein [Bacteroidetes bacterium]|nr:MAG: DUF4450 domain-containing protein [Bacteroidota bacterium]
MKQIISILFIFFLLIGAKAQPVSDTVIWHGKERNLRYQPSGSDFIITNGQRRFVRALYGTNTAFRVEAGDLPEFALYMPGMGGNFKFGIIDGNKSKWLTDARNIKATYRPGSMLYEITDEMLGNGAMFITVLALANAEGMIIQTNFKNVTGNIELMWVFGGASGKKFSRDGDIGADPESSFYLQEENCADNSFTIHDNSFHLLYNSGQKNLKKLAGVFLPGSSLKLADAAAQQSPTGLYGSAVSLSPVVTGKIKISNTASYFLIQNADSSVTKNYEVLKSYFEDAEKARKTIAGRIKVNTPDKYINTIGGALSIAADAIWEDPSYLHGAVAWRVHLNAWRGAYVADLLGWHDRARKHFSSYALSQVTTPAETGVEMDTALHLARHLEKIGTALFSDGYICRNPNGDIRAHHYDMNLVFVDQLLNHFNWTGDTSYVRQMWPLIKRHLAWEKRNFDADDDGLYDAYAAIWASDALQYSGGGVTHTSAYNYRANKTAAELASLIGEDGTIYKNEANKIYAAIQKNLWLPRQGSYAEYKDLLGNKLVHPSPGLWTIYQAIDSKVPDAFQAYLNLRYVDGYIPHIPIKAKGFDEKGLYLLSTTNWQPYTWSINNVALAENLNTALAYWQGDRNEDAYLLWRSAIIESMYMSASPGGFEQLSFYDAIRGELYRDFADPIGVAGRTLVEGLFGIQPDALHDTLTIKPGFPSTWDYASLQTPDVQFDFKRTNNTDNYVISSFFRKPLHLKLVIPAYKDDIEKILINGVKVDEAFDKESVGRPMVLIVAPSAKQYKISVYWKGKTITAAGHGTRVANGERFTISLPEMKMLKVFDPQDTIDSILIKDNTLRATAKDNPGAKTIFIQVNQGRFSWWFPVHLWIIPQVPRFENLGIRTVSISGSTNFEEIKMEGYFNDKVSNIFKHEYLSPRPTSPTLQLPTQGIGNWTYPLTIANIDDGGVRRMAGTKNSIRFDDEISFATPSDPSRNNIVFTSQWDNFPKSVTIPLSGQASQIYLLMAGSTNPMQSRMVNGIVTVNYTDGTTDTLELKNPDNWWPIEQDYYIDGFAFTAGYEIPERLYLKEGRFGKKADSYTTIRGFSNFAIEGGAATVLDMVLDKNKTLKSLTVETIANDVIVGLMALTLVREQ